MGQFQLKIRYFLRILALIGFWALIFSQKQAFAGSQTANVNVSATVINNCVVSASYPLAMGNYDPVGTNSSSGSDLTNTGNITVTCTKNDSITIALDNGQNYSNPDRRMKNGTNFLAYNIYTDGTYGTPWNATNTVTKTSGSGTTTTTFTMYAKVTKGQDLPSGSYTDLVVATVTF